MDPNVENAMIVKKTIYGGKKYVPFKDGTKVHFHFQTRMCNADKTVLDDSRKMGEKKPLEIVIGKKFKLEVWEACIQKMSLDEVAQFTVDKSLVMQYPFIAKTLRDVHSSGDKRQHCCAMTIQTQGVGYADLNVFLKNPCDLEFTMELVKIEQPDEYEKDNWQLTEDERIQSVPVFKQKGNELFKQKEYKKAATCYSQAISILEQLQLKEKPNDTEWNELNTQKNPLLLNFSQCKLFEEDFYAVIEHCTTVLKAEPDNVKALYRRGKAHIGAWNPDSAKEDLTRVMELDETLVNAVQKELVILADLIKSKDEQDKTKLKTLFTP